MRVILKKLIPAAVQDKVRKIRRDREKARVASLPPLSEADFRALLVGPLGLCKGDVVLVHSSVDRLNLGFPFFKIVGLIQEAIGPEGTQAYPTYPKLNSYDYLVSGEVFDVRRTPSFTGVLTELARRHQQAIRSVHPTKSVCAIGPMAEFLVGFHHQGLFPYGPQSPYAQLVKCGGRIIGVGVTTAHLASVHTVEDELGDRFPLRVYHDRLFEAPCINRSGAQVVVKTYAHDLSQVRHDSVPFFHNHIASIIGKDVEVNGMPFFFAQAAPLHQAMLALAQDGITIYPRLRSRKSHTTSK